MVGYFQTGSAGESTLYIASPLGFSEAGRMFLYERIMPAVQNAGWRVIDPWRHLHSRMVMSAVAMPYGEQRKARWVEIDQALGRSNAKDIRRSYGLLAVLDGPDVDSGTASEIGFAAGLGKAIIGYRGDFRLSSDNEGSMVNLQVEHFIRMNGGEIISRIDDLEERLRLMLAKTQRSGDRYATKTEAQQ